MLECVVNVSEGRRTDVVAGIAAAAGDALLDVHCDPDHHRAVLTLAGTDVEEQAFAVVAAAVARIDLRRHAGVHPRLGAADVVPFVPLSGAGLAPAIAARDRVARRVAAELRVPCFRYGPERALPEVRRLAFGELLPDTGPAHPHPTAGACCVGARAVLVAYNLWLDVTVSLDAAGAIVRDLRSPAVRALALRAGGVAQVSCNLLDPLHTGPAAVFDFVASRAPVARAEVVGLVPRAVVDATPRPRWAELDLDEARTIEARLEQAGLDGGSALGRR